MRDDPFVVEPLSGYSLTVGSDPSERLASAYSALRQGLDLAAIEAAGRELLAAQPGLHPARVLIAQVAYVRRDDLGAIELLGPIVDELPDYTAARLLLGRAAERSGDLPLALEALAELGAENPLAAGRVAEVRPRAVELVFSRLQDEIGRRRVESAEAHLEWLAKWDPEGRETLEGQRLIAVENGDLETELETVRRLGAETGDLTYLEREAELELEVGDVRAGLEKLETLVREHPADPQLKDLLELAKFLWRLQLLPPEVQAIGRQGELDRADFATLLYWLVPQIRYSEISNPPIAADILGHERRDLILRVLNLDLMEVDEVLHRFEPTEPATRLVVFQALLRLLSSSEQKHSCLEESDALTLDPSWRSVCQLTERCRLIPEAADCRPAAAVSGAEVLELFRHTLDLLGSGG